MGNTHTGTINLQIEVDRHYVTREPKGPNYFKIVTSIQQRWANLDMFKCPQETVLVYKGSESSMRIIYWCSLIKRQTAQVEFFYITTAAWRYLKCPDKQLPEHQPRCKTSAPSLKCGGVHGRRLCLS